MSNINRKITVLSTVQAAGADVVSSGGQLIISGADPIFLNKIQSGEYTASLNGLPVTYIITTAASIVDATTYYITLKQQVAGRDYIFSTEHTAVGTDAATFYGAVAAAIQAGITGGQILGSVSSSAGGVVFTGTADAPVTNISGSQFSASATSNVLTAAGSSCTDAAPRVLTAGSAHGLTVGKVYQFTFTGVTDAGAADLNRTLFGVPASATTITLFGTSATGTVDTTTGTLTVDNTGDENFANLATFITGFNSSNAYVGVEIEALNPDPINAGNVIPQLILADATSNSVANINAFVNALRTALASTPAAIG